MAKAKPGVLRAKWTKKRSYGVNYGTQGDVEFHWGDGCGRSDGHMLHHALSAKVFGGDVIAHRAPNKSLLDELVARGYDITTLRFTIRKHHPAAPSHRAVGITDTNKGASNG